ncbi:MAG TPA: hypothetical protein V6D19_09345, partial [Stenomitos sp.]
MVSFGTVGVQRRAFMLKAASGVSSLVLVLLTSAMAHAQKAGDFSGIGQPTNPNNNVQLLSPTGGQSGLFSIEAAKRMMTEAEGAVAAQNYDLASKKLQDARQVSNQLSNFYQALAGSFLGVDNRASDSLRRKALDTAQIRDQSTYQLALVYRAQSKTELAIPLLIEI